MEHYLVKKRATVPENDHSETAAIAGPSRVNRDVCDEPEQKKSRPRFYKFSEKWKENREWLTYNAEEKKMYCTYCTFCQKRNNKFVIGCDSSRMDNVKAHETSTMHKCCHTAFLNRLKPPADQPILKAVMNLKKHDIDLMKRHFTTAFYIAKHEKPYTDFAGLNELQHKNYGNESGEAEGKVKQHYNSDKQASNFVRYIAKAEREKIIEDINNCEVIAVAVDGATDSANTEQELFYVVYLDENFNSKETYIKIVNVKGRATARGLSKCFFETFRELGIDVHAKCVQLATDGPSVMKNMCANVKAEIDWILHFHCINHR